MGSVPTRQLPRLLALAAVVALATAGCASSSSPSSTPPATPVPTPTVAPTPTAAPTAGGTGGGPSNVPTTMPELPPWTCDGTTIHLPGNAVRAEQTGLGASNDGTIGRVELTFRSPPGTPTFPEVVIKPSTPPFVQDPSGLPIEVQGTAWATIVLQGGTGIDVNGNPTYVGSNDVAMDGRPIVEVRRAGDVEAVSTWIVGLAGPYCVRVFAQASPNGLIVEFRPR